MKKKFIGGAMLGILSIMALASCTSGDTNTPIDVIPENQNNQTNTNNDNQVSVDTTEMVFSDEYDEYDNQSSTFQMSLATAGIGNFTQEGNVYTITEGGEYNLKGVLPDGMIIVNSTDTVNKVIINLEGCTITSTTNSPIFIEASETDVEISAKNGTTNTIIDRREEIDEEDETQGTAAIYSKVDLELKGKGTLNVVGAINNGIHSKDDLKIKNQTLNVKAVNNALKGNDSVTITNVTGEIISVGGDGIKTTNSDISSKGNQRGTVTITGTSALDIYACCDGIDAAYNTEILKDESNNEPTLNIYTSSYSSYSGDVASNVSTSNALYLSITNTYYNSSYNYYAYCYNFDSNNNKVGEWVKLDYYTQVQTQIGPGGFSQTSYYYLKGNIDSSKYNNVQFYIFTSNNPSEEEYYAQSTGQTINATKDMFQVSSVTASTKKIGGDWTSYTSSSQSQFGMGPGGMGMMDQGNTEKTEYSTKGIKADNEINISAGNIKIEAYDDALHANGNLALENSETSTGNINISGGTLSITSKDDGIHGEGSVTLSGGKISVLTSYEGIEGPTINFTGSVVDVYATDDGVNAGGKSGAINVSGGFLFSTVGTGDTDSIDANGTYTQTGGVVISAAGGTTGTATALDTDGAVKITGGTLMCLGTIERAPSASNVKTYSIPSLSSGSYTFSKDSLSYTFSLKNTYSQSSIKFYGDSGSYVIEKGGSILTSFTI